ncbi:MAG: glycosyltransferase family 2 protein, partial [Halanaerobiales bacterium]
MNIMNYVIDVFLIGYSLYFLVFVFFGLFTREDKKIKDPDKKFAVIIPAHNEEKVISKLLTNVQKLDYPNTLYDIFVVADNCSDNTAVIARSHNVNVIRRTNNLQKGKGYALKYAFTKLGFINGTSNYDAAVIFDAD